MCSQEIKGKYADSTFGQSTAYRRRLPQTSSGLVKSNIPLWKLYKLPLEHESMVIAWESESLPVNMFHQYKRTKMQLYWPKSHCQQNKTELFQTHKNAIHVRCVQGDRTPPTASTITHRTLHLVTVIGNSCKKRAWLVSRSIYQKHVWRKIGGSPTDLWPGREPEHSRAVTLTLYQFFFFFFLRQFFLFEFNT